MPRNIAQLTRSARATPSRSCAKRCF